MKRRRFGIECVEEDAWDKGNHHGWRDAERVEEREDLGRVDTDWVVC